MQELVVRLTTLDPEVSESLKVIAYFDALVEGHASMEVPLRGAAVLTECAAGCTTWAVPSPGDHAILVHITGRRSPTAPADAGRPALAGTAFGRLGRRGLARARGPVS